MTNQLLVQWNTHDIAKVQADYLLIEGYTKDEDEVLQSAFEDYDLYRFEWECLLDNLTELINQRNPDGNWYAKMPNFGWRGTNGEKFFFADTGKDFLGNILPDTDCQFKIFDYHDGLKLQNFHHDAPTGREMYYIKPAAMCQVCGDLLLEIKTCPKCSVELCPDCYGPGDNCTNCDWRLYNDSKYPMGPCQTDYT